MKVDFQIEINQAKQNPVVFKRISDKFVHQINANQQQFPNESKNPFCDEKPPDQINFQQNQTEIIPTKVSKKHIEVNSASINVPDKFEIHEHLDENTTKKEVEQINRRSNEEEMLQNDISIETPPESEADIYFEIMGDVKKQYNSLQNESKKLLQTIQMLKKRSSSKTPLEIVHLNQSLDDELRFFKELESENNNKIEAEKLKYLSKIKQSEDQIRTMRADMRKMEHSVVEKAQKIFALEERIKLMEQNLQEFRESMLKEITDIERMNSEEIEAEFYLENIFREKAKLIQTIMQIEEENETMRSRIHQFNDKNAKE